MSPCGRRKALNTSQPGDPGRIGAGAAGNSLRHSKPRIWHETFRVRAGEHEAVYGNMPVFGLAAASTHAPAARKNNTAAVRIGASTTDEPAVAPY